MIFRKRDRESGARRLWANRTNELLFLALLVVCYATGAYTKRVVSRPRTISRENLPHPPDVFVVVGKDVSARYQLLALYEYSGAIIHTYANPDEAQGAEASWVKMPIVSDEDACRYDYYLPDDKLQEIESAVTKEYERRLEEHAGRRVPARVNIRILKDDKANLRQTIALREEHSTREYTYIYEAHKEGVLPLKYGRFTKQELVLYVLPRVWRMFLIGLGTVAVGQLVTGFIKGYHDNSMNIDDSRTVEKLPGDD